MKGVRKDPRKFGSSVDRFSVNHIVYYHYTRSELHLISQCDLKQYFFLVRQDYERNLAANYMAELVDHLMQVEQKSLPMYQLMIHYLETLESIKDIDRLVHVFQIKALLFSGFRPNIDACVKSGRKLSSKALFSVKEGGLLHPDLSYLDVGAIAVSKGAIATLLHIEQSGWPQVLKLGLTSPIRKELKYILNNFLVYHLGKKVKTAKYMT
jgi:DNA repair protein RecO (recombination protein O)